MYPSCRPSSSPQPIDPGPLVKRLARRGAGRHGTLHHVLAVRGLVLVTHEIACVRPRPAYDRLIGTHCDGLIWAHPASRDPARFAPSWGWTGRETRCLRPTRQATHHQKFLGICLGTSTLSKRRRPRTSPHRSPLRATPARDDEHTEDRVRSCVEGRPNKWQARERVAVVLGRELQLEDDSPIRSLPSPIPDTVSQCGLQQCISPGVPPAIRRRHRVLDLDRQPMTHDGNGRPTPCEIPPPHPTRDSSRRPADPTRGRQRIPRLSRRDLLVCAGAVAAAGRLTGSARSAPRSESPRGTPWRSGSGGQPAVRQGKKSIATIDDGLIVRHNDDGGASGRNISEH